MKVPAPKLMLLTEVADAARAPITSVRGWIANETLPSSRRGKRRLVRKKDLAMFLHCTEAEIEIDAPINAKVGVQ